MKPKSENIQRNISTRLNKVKNQLSVDDFDYLWGQTHNLYEYALSLESCRPSKISEIRHQNQLFPFAEEFKAYWLKEYGKDLDGASLHWIYDFALFMAKKKNYTFQPAIEHIDDFTTDLD